MRRMKVRVFFSFLALQVNRLYQEVHLNALHLEVYITCPETVVEVQQYLYLHKRRTPTNSRDPNRGGQMRLENN